MILTDKFPSGNIFKREGIDFLGFCGDLYIVCCKFPVGNSDQSDGNSESTKACNTNGLMIRKKNGAHMDAVSSINYAT